MRRHSREIIDLRDPAAVDRELRRRFQAGDAGAVQEVYERHGRTMFSVALSVLGSRELAADCVQQAFVQAWRAAGSFDEERALGPWLHAITRRAAIDLYRREARHRTVDGDRAPEPSTEPVAIERTWETWEVRRALDQLPDDEREVIRLSHLEGLTHTEIAARTGVPVGTVKSRSHRAHQRLVELLDHLRETAS